MEVDSPNIRALSPRQHPEFVGPFLLVPLVEIWWKETNNPFDLDLHKRSISTKALPDIFKISGFSHRKRYTFFPSVKDKSYCRI
jgi:hypothetical protein